MIGPAEIWGPPASSTWAGESNHLDDTQPLGTHILAGEKWENIY